MFRRKKQALRKKQASIEKVRELFELLERLGRRGGEERGGRKGG